MLLYIPGSSVRQKQSNLHQAGINDNIDFKPYKDTAIVPQGLKAVMNGMPLSPIHRVAGSIVLAITDPDPRTHGAAYTIPDEREVFLIPHTELNDNVFSLLSERAKRPRR